MQTVHDKHRATGRARSCSSAFAKAVQAVYYFLQVQGKAVGERYDVWCARAVQGVH